MVIATVVKKFLSSMLPADLVEAIRLIRIRRRTQRNSIAIAGRNREFVERLLLDGNPIQVELGAGARRMKGWTSVDIDGQADICSDLNLPLPFPDDSVDQIYASHVLEHFSYPHPLMDLVSECYRILKPGSLFKIAVPDAGIYLRGYFEPDKFDPDHYCRYKPAYYRNSKIDYVNYMAYMNGRHRYMFDEENLQTILLQSGFCAVGLRQFDPELDLESRKYESLYVQAAKPTDIITK